MELYTQGICPSSPPREAAEVPVSKDSYAPDR